jgi:hypothetical protein
MRELDEICKLMRRFPYPWFFVGGWAIDIHLGRQTRPHNDIEFSIFRNDQAAFRVYFKELTLRVFVPGSKEHQIWNGEELKLPIHQLRSVSENGPNVDVMLNESDDKNWIYRRNQSIKREKRKAILTSNSIPHLAPEIVLLYKTKNTKSKDNVDFEAALPDLSSEQRQWLKEALKNCDPDHGWLKIL